MPLHVCLLWADSNPQPHFCTHPSPEHIQASQEPRPHKQFGSTCLDTFDFNIIKYNSSLSKDRDRSSGSRRDFQPYFIHAPMVKYHLNAWVKYHLNALKLSSPFWPFLPWTKENQYILQYAASQTTCCLIDRAALANCDQ